MKFVQQQFFPSSDRDELIIDWNLPENASIIETNAQMLASSVNNCREMPELMIGRPTSEPALRVLCCHSICKQRTPGLARSSL
jgi:hypothetical protein